MNHYFEVLKGTEEYEILDKVFNWNNSFRDKKKAEELAGALGLENINDVGMNDSALALKEVPDKIKSQFKKNKYRGFYIAKKNTPLNQAFLEWIKKYNVKKVPTAEFSSRFLPHGIKSYHRIFNRYFIRPKTINLLAFKNHKSLKEIKESNYLRLRAEYLDKIEQS